MIINDYFSVNNAELILRNKNQFEEIIKNLSDKKIEILNYKHKDLKNVLLDKFSNQGWALRPRVYTDKGEYIDLLSSKTGIHFQFGHHAQIYVDILKFSYMFHEGLIDIGVSVVPSDEYSYGNRVKFDSWKEKLSMYSTFLSTPILLLELK
tara:strand:+ start:1150 stop:1602 length:453 start_codon:yes stop_codon:yes gene_type:complete